MTKALAVLCVVLGVLVGATGLASAEIPSNVRDGKSGRIDAGWVRAACATTQDGAKCAVRFPRGIHRLDLTYRRGGKAVASESTVTYTKPVAGPVRTFNRRVVAGVRLKCTSRGNRAKCDLVFAERMESLNVNLYVPLGWFGGIRT